MKRYCEQCRDFHEENDLFYLCKGIAIAADPKCRSVDFQVLQCWVTGNHPPAGRCRPVFQMLIAFALSPFVLSPSSCSPTSEKHQFDVFHWYVPPSSLSALIVSTKVVADKCATNNKKSPALSNRGLMSILSTVLFYLRLCID